MPDFVIIDLAGIAVHLLLHLLTSEAKPGAGLLSGHYSDCSFGIVARRTGKLRAGKSVLAAAIYESFSQRLRFLLGFRNGRRDHVAEVLRPSLIAMPGSFVSVKVP